MHFLRTIATFILFTLVGASMEDRDLKTGGYVDDDVTPAPTMSPTAKLRPRRHRQCSVQPTCVELGLVTGLCCPTADGVRLDCCQRHNNTTRTTMNDRPTTTTITDQDDIVDAASCSAHSTCTANNLTGHCCPTAEGVYLDCCGPPGGMYF